MNLRDKLRAAKARTFQRYAEKYGELHPRDPQANEVIVLGPDADVAEILRRLNEGEPYPFPPDVSVRQWDPSGPYA
jgi:hypothetical protein